MSVNISKTYLVVAYSRKFFEAACWDLVAKIEKADPSITIFRTTTGFLIGDIEFRYVTMPNFLRGFHGDRYKVVFWERSFERPDFQELWDEAQVINSGL